ncbi:1082_t:CDS:2 [Acaulospora colombiana]|uniref:1082_t:CDS:1 n=1 Tax=Acaulospora colombiana TaxID=27376 RepID=A0ACA9JZ28_9GLOM|nr:1082_t:CDS:2 [Acaulospora colombiana]
MNPFFYSDATFNQPSVGQQYFVPPGDDRIAHAGFIFGQPHPQNERWWTPPRPKRLAIINPKDKSVVLEGFIARENKVIEVIKSQNACTEQIIEPSKKQQEYVLPTPDPDNLATIESSSAPQRPTNKITPGRMALIELLKREIAKKSAQLRKEEVVNARANYVPPFAPPHTLNYRSFKVLKLRMGQQHKDEPNESKTLGELTETKMDEIEPLKYWICSTADDPSFQCKVND